MLALDAPSGLDLESGDETPGSVRATATMTLALPKSGLIGADDVGELYVADISVPDRVFATLGVAAPGLFRAGPVERLVHVGEDSTSLRTSDCALTWSTPMQCARLIARGATFSTAARIAVVVGTLLTIVNLGGVIVGGRADMATVVQAVANYAIPYGVSSLGVLSHTRLRAA